MTMTDRATLRPSAVAALKLAGTLAGNSVYSPNDWPNDPNDYPGIVVRTPHERKENCAPRNGPPAFFTTIILSVIGRISADTEVLAESQLETLSAQIEKALLTNQQFINDNGILQFSSVETAMDIRSESEYHIGETVTAFHIEVYQEYYPTLDTAGIPIAPSLTEVDITVLKNPGGKQLPTGVIHLTGA